MSPSLVLVLSVLIGLAGVEAALSDSCDVANLRHCTKQIEELNSESAFSLGSDLEKACGVLDGGLKCIDQYSARCLPASAHASFKAVYNGSFSVIREICEPGPSQDEYLKHASCLDSAKAQYKLCLSRYNDVSPRITPTATTDRDKTLKLLCCSFNEYIDCSKNLIYNRCGPETATYAENFLDRLASPVVANHCKSHVANPTECEILLVNTTMGAKPIDPVVSDADGRTVDSALAGSQTTDEDDGGGASALSAPLALIVASALTLGWRTL